MKGALSAGHRPPRPAAGPARNPSTWTLHTPSGVTVTLGPSHPPDSHRESCSSSTGAGSPVARSCLQDMWPHTATCHFLYTDPGRDKALPSSALWEMFVLDISAQEECPQDAALTPVASQSALSAEEEGADSPSPAGRGDGGLAWVLQGTDPPHPVLSLRPPHALDFCTRSGARRGPGLAQGHPVASWQSGWV